ncbi:MAG: PQQ-binding-like beta-propeller repeat protein, partial [Phycisphaerales bacterium]
GTMLWQRPLREGVMIHRNTMIATPELLYVGDDQSCKVIDAATGHLKDEIVPPVEQAGGTFWKWMALEDGVLYAMMGQGEQQDPTKKWRRDTHGWPWDPVSEGFNQSEHPWGFGRNVLAIDPQAKKVLWAHREDEAIDGRAVCMKGGRLYIFRFGSYLACLDARTGAQLWRKTPQNAPDLFQSLGEYLERRQDWRTNWRTACYLKCSEKALYFAGPPVGKLLALSAEDGSILWENAYSNFQLVLREDGLYAISGQIDKHPSKRFDPLTGEVLGEIVMHRRACTRPNGSADAIFFRAEGGSVRLDMASQRAGWISPMRPNCHDGVTIANGLLYWWPSVCDCQLTLYGITSLAPAGDFDFTPVATETRRLERGDSETGTGTAVSKADWPTFRADNTCSATTPVSVSPRVVRQWQFDAGITSPRTAEVITAPVTADGVTFVAGCDGVVRAVDVATGQLRWKAYTSGAIRMAPTVWQGRVYVGSGDGWVYALDASTGGLLWRFRAAPAERRIPVYGALMSTWPAASGVLVDDGVAYVAAGIANYDGTYLYALDAKTGAIKWQNNSSGHLDKAARTGVSVQGHLLLHDGTLYLPGGTSVSPARYNARTGKCLNDSAQLAECVSRNPRGWELSLLTDHVVACGRPFYAHPEHDVYDATVFDRAFLAASGGRQVVWASTQAEQHILCFRRLDRAALARKLGELGGGFHVNWARLAPKDKPEWTFKCRKALATAVCVNCVLVATESKLVALDLSDGRTVWTQQLPAAPVPWGLAVDRAGRVIVTLKDGHVLCFGPDERV